MNTPLAPLSPLQRLGYLDAADHLTCRHPLTVTREPWSASGRCAVPPVLHFQPGQIYPLEFQPLEVHKNRLRMTPSGEAAVLLCGTESCILLRAEEQEQCAQPSTSILQSTIASLRSAVVFVDPRYLDPRSRIYGLWDAVPRLSLALLPEHFIIPEIPDAAALDPEGYARNVAALERLEGSHEY